MNLIILGASTRAAAFSAHRAGLEPWCVDLFADADLAAHFPVRQVPFSEYPRGLFAALADAPPGPLLYTGGLENYPDLLAAIDRPLWGNPPDVLRHVRSPYLVNDMLRGHGLRTLAVRAEPPASDDRRTWMLKPLRGSGGLGIRYHHGESFDLRLHYLQEHHKNGGLVGVVYLGVPGRGAVPVGATTARIDQFFTHAPGFLYDGGIVEPMPTHPNVQEIGDLLAREFHVGGLFGVDFAFDCDWEYRVFDPTEMYLIEVNPRYTASVELLERSHGISLIDLHRKVFEEGAMPPLSLPQPAVVWGKAILYALEDLVFPDEGPWLEAFEPPIDEILYADVPYPGASITRGKPVLTVFASGATTRDCHTAVTARLKALDRHLWG